MRDTVRLLVTRVARKSAKILGKYFPLNTVRVAALRAAGYSIGRSVYIGEEFHVTDELDSPDHLLFIGDRVAIAQRVLIVLSSHPNKSKLRGGIGTTSGKVIIGNDAWIGVGVIILPNVRIGEMAIIGAGSVVTRDIPPYTIAAGNPARVVKSSVEHS